MLRHRVGGFAWASLALGLTAAHLDAHLAAHLAMAGTVAPSAGYRFDTLFGDQAILPRGKIVRITGTADASLIRTSGAAPLDVVLRTNRGVLQSRGALVWETALNAQRRAVWSAQVRIPDAAGPGYSLTVIEHTERTERTANASSTSVRPTAQEPLAAAKGISIGQLWLCGGQSNMAHAARTSDVKNLVAAASHDAQLGMLAIHTQDLAAPLSGPSELRYTVPAWRHGNEDESGNVAADPEARVAMGFSGTCYAFGRELRRLTGEPVGLITAAVGGTAIERWLPANRILPNTVTRYQNSGLFNGSIAALAGLSPSGMLWYQGEANVPAIYEARDGYADFWGAGRYLSSIYSLAAGWRAHLGNPGLPFVVMQLSSYGNAKGPVGLPDLRDAQRQFVASTPNTALVVTHDLGNLDGAAVGDIHPRAKTEVGRRAAALVNANWLASRTARDPQSRVASFTVSPARGGNLVLRSSVELALAVGMPAAAEIAGFEIRCSRATDAAADLGQWRTVSATLLNPRQLQLRLSEPCERFRDLRYAWRPLAIATRLRQKNIGQAIPTFSLAWDWNPPARSDAPTPRAPQVLFAPQLGLLQSEARPDGIVEVSASFCTPRTVLAETPASARFPAGLRMSVPRALPVEVRERLTRAWRTMTWRLDDSGATIPAACRLANGTANAPRFSLRIAGADLQAWHDAGGQWGYNSPLGIGQATFR